jgi:hypothetical protein
VVGVGLGQVLLQESEVLLGASVTLTGVGRDVLSGSSRGRGESGLGSVELGELGREVGRKGRSLGGGGGGVRLDDSDVGVLGLYEAKVRYREAGPDEFSATEARSIERRSVDDGRTWGTGL